jgi:hypothetical protein
MQTAKTYGASNIVTPEQWVGTDKVRGISAVNLGAWASQTEYVVNASVDEITTLHKMIEQSDRQISELKKWVQGSATFLEFVTQRYPDVIREFNTVQNAQMRVADTKECFQIVEAE